MALGSNIEYKARALFQAALDEKSAKQVEDRFVKLSKEASEMSRKEFIAAFSSLGQEINNALSKLNLPQINMENLIKLPQVEAFSKLGTEFGTRFAEGFQGAVAGGGGISTAIQGQVQQLEAEKNRLLSLQKSLPQNLKRYEYLSGLGYAEKGDIHAFSLDEIKRMSKDGSADTLAQSFTDDYYGALDALDGLNAGTEKYHQTLLKVYEAASNVFRMQATIDKNPNLIKDKNVLMDYGYETLQETVQNELLARDEDFSNFVKQENNLLEQIPTRLTEIEQRLSAIRQNNPEIINKEEASAGIQTLNEIEAAYKRILNTHGKVGKQGSNIQNALNFDPSTSKQGIQALYDAYTKMPEDSPWEVQYQALLKYVKLYESYLNSSNTTHRNKVTKPNNEFTKLYEQLKPMAANAENMLQNVLNMANKVPLVGMGETGAEKNAEVTARAAVESQNQADAEAKARAEAEAKAKADAESAAAAEKERLAQEAEAKAAQQAAAAAEQERASKEATAKAAKETSSSYTTGGILDNPMFANMFKKTDDGAEKKHMANEGSAEAAERELNATKQTTEELEKQQKLLLYRRVEGQADLNRVSGRSIDALYDKANKPIIQGALEMGFGGFGDGLYTTTFDAAKDLLPGKGNFSFFEFDASSYNLFINKTVEQAQALQSFLLSLQKFVGAGTLLDTSELTHIADLSKDQLFEEAQRIFKNFSMTKQQFDAWIESARVESETIANLFANGQVPSNRHNFGTRFMQALGYEGVLNQTGNLDIDGNYQGSVIYDPKDDIKQNARVFNSTEEFAAYIKAQAQAHQENTSAINAEAQAQENLNKAKTQQTQIEQLDNDGVEASEESAKTEAIKQQNGALQENINLKAQANGQSIVTGGTGIGTGGTGTTPTKVIPTQTVPDGATSAEATEIEAVRAKVLEVTNAVNTKTQAFLAEQKAVKGVAQSEVHAMSQVEKSVTAVRVALNNLQTKQHKINLTVAGGEDISNISATETQALTKLRAALQLTTQRVNEKTQAFEAEKSVVVKVVNSEINALSRLNTQVDAVNKTIMALLPNIQTAQAGAAGIVIPQAQPTPQNNTGAQGQGSSGGSTTSPQLLNAKIDTQFSSLSLMYAQLESVGKLTPRIQQQWEQLWDSLSNVKDGDSLRLWREELNQVRNSMKEIMIANDLVEKEGVQSFQQLISVTKLYNQMVIGVTKAKTPEEKSFYNQEANNLLVEQHRILQGITLTKEQQAKYDELAAQRQREINKIQAAQAGAENAKKQKQEEAVIVRELVGLYEQLGRARAQGDYTTASAIRSQIKTERGKLSTVDRATDDKFAQATSKGEKSVADEASKAATKAQNEALKERQRILGDLIRLHRELGVLEEKEKSSAVSDSKRQQYRAEIYELYKQISAKEQLIVLSQEEVALLNQTHFNAGRSARISNAGEREAELNKLMGQYAKLGEAQANAEYKGTNEAKERFAVLAKEIAEKKESLQLTQQELDILRQIVAESYKKQSGILAKGQQDKDFKQQIKDSQKEAGLTRSSSVATKAETALTNAMGLEGISDSQVAKLEQYQSKIVSLQSLIKQLRSQGSPVTDAQKQELISQTMAVDNYTKEIQELIANYERLSGPNAQSLNATSKLGLGATAGDYQKELTTAVQTFHHGRASIKSFDAETNTLTYTLKTGKGEFTQYAASVRQTDGALMSVRGTTTRAMGVFESIGKKIKEYSYYFTGSMMIYRVIAWVREGITAVTDIDKALTELKKVTDETEESYDKFLDTAAKTASKVGSTIKDVVSSTADWARLGYAMEEAHTLATSTQILMNVSEFEDVSKATDTLISAVQAFKYTAEESMDVVDILNTIGKELPTITISVKDQRWFRPR